jgi:hypothetical protein
LPQHRRLHQLWHRQHQNLLRLRQLLLRPLRLPHQWQSLRHRSRQLLRQLRNQPRLPLLRV